jgi:hypothetical protein
MNTQPIRICYQSYVDYENGKTYWDTLGAYLKKITYPGTTIDIRGITPFDSYAHSLVEMRCAREMICNAVAAEREGYDAFIVGHFQDAGLYEARAVVDIPVVPDDKCIVTLTLRSNRVTYHLPGTAHLDQAVGIRVKGRDAANIDGGTRISDFFQVRTQRVPVGLSVLVVHITLIADPYRLCVHLSPSLRSFTE